MIVSRSFWRLADRYRFKGIQVTAGILIVRPLDDVLGGETDLRERTDDEVALTAMRFQLT
jgi:hypothetical protein